MMSHEPQSFAAPDGTAMVILTAAEYARLRRIADEAEDVADGRAVAALAGRAGLSQVWISRIEAGGGHGSPATRRKLAKALDAPAWALESEEQG